MMPSRSDDPPKDIVLPTLKYGYRETPLTWKEIQQIVLVEQNYDRLTRSAVQQHDYELSKRKIQSEWVSMHDYVLCSKFEMLFEVEKGLKRVVRNEQDDKRPRTALVRNDFPYCFEDSVQHWILWTLDGSCKDSDISKAKMNLKLRSQLPIVDMLHWINPPRLQSLPGIDHVHILVLLRTG